MTEKNQRWSLVRLRSSSNIDGSSNSRIGAGVGAGSMQKTEDTTEADIRLFEESIVLAFEQTLLPTHKYVSDEATARQAYMQDVSPVLSSNYLASLRQNRASIVREFVQNFLHNHDDSLEQGSTDEQDILLNFIKEKTFLTVGPPSVISTHVPPQETHPVEEKDLLLDLGRLHCWVMILAGKRDVTESFFVEPSTGSRYSLKGSPYQAVDLVFNHYNVWINVQHEIHGGSGSVDAISWEFRDSSNWEKLFESDQLSAFQSTERKDSLGSNTPPSIANGKSNPETTGGTLAGQKLDSQRANRLNTDCSPTWKSAEDVKCSTRTYTATTEAARMYQWILPLSWVPKLIIPMQAFITRFPNGAKRVYYYRCEHVLFAFYGDYMRYDGMVERVMLYADDKRTQLIECHDFFQRRKDKLTRRVYYITYNKDLVLIHDQAASNSIDRTCVLDVDMPRAFEAVDSDHPYGTSGYDNEGYTVLKQHCSFFVRNSDGIIVSTISVFFIKETFSYATLPVQETFGLGTVFSIKEITIVDGRTQQFDFYPGSRVDGLLTREEAFGQHLTEKYDTRSSGLSYQCAQYDDCCLDKSSTPALCKDTASMRYKLDPGRQVSNSFNVRHERMAKFHGKFPLEPRKVKSGGKTKSSAGSSFG